MSCFVGGERGLENVSRSCAPLTARWRFLWIWKSERKGKVFSPSVECELAENPFLMI